MGVRLRLLSMGPHGYTLRGLASALSRPENDPTLAMVEEMAGLHHKLISMTLPKLRSGKLWNLADQDGELIARSSRVLEAFQAEIIQPRQIDGMAQQCEVNARWDTRVGADER
jgi:hypothetical protein